MNVPPASPGPAPEAPFLTVSEQSATEAALIRHLGDDLPIVPDSARLIFLRQHEPLRTATLLRSYELLGGAADWRFDLAAVLEYLSCATGLHHRVREATSSRRKRLELDFRSTETSILLGDYLLSISFHALTQLGDLDLLETISEATQRISRGQIQELSQDWLEATPQDWEDVVRNKFASLFAAAAKMGAIAAQAPEAEWPRWEAFGEWLGLALRIRREVRHCEQAERLLNRIQRQDLLLPLLTLSQHAQRETQGLLGDIQQTAQRDDELMARLQEPAIRNPLKQRAHAYWKQARAALPEAYQQARLWTDWETQLMEGW